MIEVKEITKQYGEKVVLDKVGMQFNKRKITLLSVISRLLSQDDGVVLVDEKMSLSIRLRCLHSGYQYLNSPIMLD